MTEGSWSAASFLPYFWEMQVLAQGIFCDGKRDVEDTEGSSLISSMTTHFPFFHIIRRRWHQTLKKKIKPQGARELCFKHQDSS